MADNFTKFSFLIKNATKKEVAWLEEVLAYDFEDRRATAFPAGNAAHITWPRIDIRVLARFRSCAARPDVEGPTSKVSLGLCTRERESLDGCSSCPCFSLQIPAQGDCSLQRGLHAAAKCGQTSSRAKTSSSRPTGIFRTGGIGIKMCEALAAQQQQRIRWDGLDIIIRPRKVRQPCPRSP